MKTNQKLVYSIAIVVILCTIGLDQLTKVLASKWLATDHPGSFTHTIELVVPPDFAGKTLHDLVQSEFGSKNTPEELTRIEDSATSEGRTLSPSDLLTANEKIDIGWREITVIPGYWDYQYTRNNGAAFSFLADSDSPLRTPFFILISAIAVVVILFLLKGVTMRQKMLLFGLSLICGGAAGNLIDRFFYGYVIDFIVWKYTNQYRWPTFNVADSAIVVGVILLALNILFEGKSKENPKAIEAATAGGSDDSSASKETLSKEFSAKADDVEVEV